MCYFPEQPPLDNVDVSGSNLIWRIIQAIVW